ncbi:MAG: hypothetical protein WCB27_09540 [Thermoguttaceae bacterium]
MNFVVALSVLASLVAAPVGEHSAAENPVFKQLLAEGIKMSDGKSYKLRPPIMADGLDATAQLAAIEEVAGDRYPVRDVLSNDYYAPVVTRVRDAKPRKGEKPAIRTVDVWFVAHGDWSTLVSKDFLESTTAAENGKSRVVLKSGGLTEQELQKRNLTATVTADFEQRFLYTTFWLFDRVQVSATRFSVLTRGKDLVLAAGRIEPRFDNDADYPNQWRPLLRDAEANIKPGPPHPFTRAGGYAKITRLKQPAGAAFIECHLIYEEPYGWFDGINLVKQKVPAMVQEKVRTFRRKLHVASEKKSEKKASP